MGDGTRRGDGPLSPQVLWLIPAAWLQWLLLAVAALLSASVLALTFWPLVRADGRATALAVVAAVVSLHTLLAVGCKVPAGGNWEGVSLGGPCVPAAMVFLFLSALLFPAAAEHQPSPFTVPHHGGGRGAPQPCTAAPWHQHLPAGHPPCAVRGRVPGSRGSSRPWHRAPRKDVTALSASAWPQGRRGGGPQLPCAGAAPALAPLSLQLVSMQTDPNKPGGMSSPAPHCFSPAWGGQHPKTTPGGGRSAGAGEQSVPELGCGCGSQQGRDPSKPSRLFSTTAEKNSRSAIPMQQPGKGLPAPSPSPAQGVSPPRSRRTP